METLSGGKGTLKVRCGLDGKTPTVPYLGPPGDDVDTEAKADPVCSEGLAAAKEPRKDMNSTLGIL